jgi:hypothetical protein
MIATVSPGRTRRDRLRRVEAEAHPVEFDTQRALRHRDRPRRIGHRRTGVDHLIHPFGRGPGELGQDEHRGHGAGGGGHGGDIGAEREEGAETDPAVEREPAADGDHHHQPRLRDRRQRGGEAGVDPGRAHPLGEQPAAVLFEHIDHAGFLAEPLHHPDPGDRLLHMLGEFGRPLLGRPRGGVQLGPHPVHHHDHQRHHQQRHRRQWRGQPQHHRGGEHELQKRHSRERGHRQQGLHQLKIGDRAGNHLSGAQRVLTGAVQPLQRTEQLHPQPVLDVQ